jgi:hypothetical protein
MICSFSSNRCHTLSLFWIPSYGYVSGFPPLIGSALLFPFLVSALVYRPDKLLEIRIIAGQFTVVSTTTFKLTTGYTNGSLQLPNVDRPRLNDRQSHNLSLTHRNHFHHVEEKETE